MSAQTLLEEVALRLVALETPALVGVDGPDGSGKTTFADGLAATVARTGHAVVRASVDGFHHPRQHRHALGRTPETVWSRHFDHEALVRELLHPWRRGPGSQYRRRWHDLATDRPVLEPTEVVPEGAVLLVDGLFLHREVLVDLWDLTVYLDVPDGVAISRVATPDRALYDPSRYVGAQRLYRKLCAPRDRADILIDNTDPREPVILR